MNEETTEQPRLEEVAYRSFWSQYLNAFHQNYPGLAKVKSPSGTTWVTLGTLRKGVCITSSFVKNVKLTCDIYIDVRPEERNRNIFDALLHQRAEIENDLGVELIWDTMERGQAYRLRLECDAEIGNQKRWPEMIDWLSKWHSSFSRVIGPIVRSLDDSYWTDPLTE